MGILPPKFSVIECHLQFKDIIPKIGILYRTVMERKVEATIQGSGFRVSETSIRIADELMYGSPSYLGGEWYRGGGRGTLNTKL